MNKQVIILRTKYPDGRGGQMGMRTGKIAAQVAHASMKVFFDRKITQLGGYRIDAYLERAEGRPDFPEDTEYLLAIPLNAEMHSWVNGVFTKVVVGVETEEALLRCHELAKAAGLPTAVIQDMGATEFHGVPTYTTCAIGPADAAEIDKITGPDGLVKVKLL